MCRRRLSLLSTFELLGAMVAKSRKSGDFLGLANRSKEAEQPEGAVERPVVTILRAAWQENCKHAPRKFSLRFLWHQRQKPKSVFAIAIAAFGDP